ncbi:MAG TPA: DegT/DnrJ/EryC1/StrS family aminotransferase [Terriglobales bacterium]|nr:DegT/DnrJ/EryC1/StrS family aminotransferase [Terriglobales bacterium]
MSQSTASPSAAKVSWPIITEADRAAVLRVLDRKILWAQTRPEGLYAPEQQALEREFADFVGARYALAVNGGTAGLHMALVAAGVEPGDEVITSAFSFLATPAAILHAGAKPVFVDIDPRTFNLDPAQVEAKITPRTKAIMAVDIHGLCADFDALLAICKKHKIALTEDACQAPGATLHGKGAGTFGIASGFSVNGTKNFAVGEGGFMVTNDEDAYFKGNWLKQVGEGLPATDRTMEFQHLLAWNYRVQELPCAFGRSQLSRLAEVNATGQRNAAILAEYLKDLPGVRAPYVPQGYVSVYHKYRITLVPEELPTKLRGATLRDAFMKALGAQGVDCDLWGNAPLCEHPMMKARYPNDHAAAYPKTVAMFANSFCLTNDEFPIYAQPAEVIHAYGAKLRAIATSAIS